MPISIPAGPVETVPFGYDVDNDMLKVGGLYLAAAGLSGYIQYSSNPVAAGGFVDTGAVAGAFYTVPVGKTVLITDLMTSAHNGKVQSEVQINGTGIGVAIISPNGGGSDFRTFATPLVVTAGQTVDFQVYNIDAVNTAPAFMVRANYIEL